MGQSASKSVAKAAQQVSHAPSRPRRAEHVISAVSSSSSRPPPREFSDNRATTASTNQNSEMPPELVKFLRDAGPLKPKAERGVTTESTPKPMPRHLDRSTDHRLESMRLAENVPGFNTNRTTSFSHKHDASEENEFRLDVIDMYQLLAERKVDDFYNQQLDSYPEKPSASEQENHRRLLKQSLDFIELPVILRDTDNTYVGASSDRVEDLKMMKLSETFPTQVKLVLRDLHEERLKQKEQAT